jgi:apolipoprotein N-acyltransferase
MSKQVASNAGPLALPKLSWKRPWARMPLAARLIAAIVVGCTMHYVVGLEPVWWLVWILPAALLVLAFGCPGAILAGSLTLLAASIGLSANFSFYREIMPLQVAIWVTFLQAFPWVLVVLSTRLVVLRFQAWWTVLAYPVFWVATDMVMTLLLPDGDWGHFVYSQAEFLPMLQLTSLFGVAGLLFVLTLVPSAIALMCTFWRKLEHGAAMSAGVIAICAACALYGQLRLQTPVRGTPTMIGMASIDDYIHKSTPAEIEAVWKRYDEMVTGLAARGAQLVVLPEKIQMLTPAQVDVVQRRLGALAARNQVWVDAGVELKEDTGKRNLAWRFNPDGKLAQVYQKHHFVAPVERDFIAGSDYPQTAIGGANYGMAICKDMTFASYGRELARRQAGVMLVPAWDFILDGRMSALITQTRAVEGGFTIVRVARLGLLMATDPYGRMLAEQPSSTMPGSSSLVSVRGGQPVPTLYGRIGDLFGWTCVGLAVIFRIVARRNAGRQT